MVAFFRLSSLVFRLIMKWILAVFGRAGSPFIADEVEKYVKRLRGSAMPLEVVELKESKIDDHAQALAQEAALLDGDLGAVGLPFSKKNSRVTSTAE